MRRPVQQFEFSGQHRDTQISLGINSASSLQLLQKSEGWPAHGKPFHSGINETTSRPTVADPYYRLSDSYYGYSDPYRGLFDYYAR